MVAMFTELMLLILHKVAGHTNILLKVQLVDSVQVGIIPGGYCFN